MRSRNLQTLDEYRKALLSKYGVGEGESYKPWLRVQDVKSKGVRSQVSGLKSGRIHHTLSALETEFFYLAEYSDSVVDIREQFPLFPLNLSQKIAKSLGIKHPSHPQSGEPIIMTTDFLITRKVNQKITYEAVSVKPINESNNLRVLEKLEIERVWWSLLDIPFYFFVGSETTRIQSNNINWASHPLRVSPESFNQSELEEAVSLIEVGRHFIREICNLFVFTLGIDEIRALNLLKSLITKKYITVDLTNRLEDADFIKVLDVLVLKRAASNGNS
jgi:hypothetical protein